jgi:hypothetical protein
MALNKRPRKSIRFGLRVTEADKHSIEKVATKQDVTISQKIRQWIRQGLERERGGL